MKNIFIFTALCFSIFLGACGPIYQTTYRYQAPVTSEGRMCANSCLDKMSACKSQCETEAAQCRHIKSLEGENAYLRYLNEQKTKGAKADKTLINFQDFSSCSNGCQERCENVHRICHVNCGGDVLEERRCTAFCDR